MRPLILILTLLVFANKTYATQPQNDSIGGAIDLTTLIDSNNGSWCSASDSITYNNEDATADGAKPSCMHPAHNVVSNVWFKYKVGSSKEFNLDLKIEGITSSLIVPYLTMWTDDDTTDNSINLIEVECRKYKGGYDNIGIGKANLIEGQYYYVSVDNSSYNPSEGNFQICASDVVNYDFVDGAVDVTSLINSNGGSWCSADDSITYNNEDAAPEGAKPSCMHPAHNVISNVWFKYKVGTSKEFNLDLKIEGIASSIVQPYLTMWTDDDTTDSEINLIEVECRMYKGGYDNIGIGKANLIEGQYYYVSVDNSSYSPSEGNFQVCASDQVSYDFVDGAVDVTSLINSNGGSWCSASDSITYNNGDATADGAKPSCMHPAHNVVSNVWFKYKVGSSKEFNLDLKIEGITSSLIVPYLTMWTDDDTTDSEINLIEVECRKYKGAYDNIGIGVANLIEGQYYYVSVDNSSYSPSEGNFQICASDQVSYDFVDGAADITSLVASNGGSWCSADDSITYNNGDATPDGAKPGCMSHSVNSDVWFKYQVSSSQALRFELNISGVTGNLRYPYMAFWKDSDTTDSQLTLVEVACENYSGIDDNIWIEKAGLTVGQDYYISIDNASTGAFGGNFQICVSDQISYDLAAGALDLTSKINSNGGIWCSAEDTITYSTVGATLDESSPSCLLTGHNWDANVWFKYLVGPSKEFNFEMKVSGITGAHKKASISLWTDTVATDGILTLVEVQCEASTGDYTDNALGVTGLNEGQYYYVMVHPYHPVYAGNFQICVSDQASNDFAAGALDLTSKINSNGGFWCSAQDTITYTTVGATLDESAPSCLLTGHNWDANVWFKYLVGPSKEFNFEMKVSGITGAHKKASISIWTDNDTTDGVLTLVEVQCEASTGDYSDNALGVAGLNEGQYYYVMVHPYHPVYAGNFQICVSDQVSYDFIAGAADMTAKLDSNDGYWSSVDSGVVYTSQSSTLDGEQPSCQSNVKCNVWFKYHASAYGQLDVEALTGGSEGTMGRVSLSVWKDTTGNETLKEVGCLTYYSGNSAYADRKIEGIDLEPNKTFYISIQTYSGVYLGTFNLVLERTQIKTPADLFSMNLYYNSTPSVLDDMTALENQYNGNISAVDWQVLGEDIKAYTYEYDPLNRIINANYGRLSTINGPLGY